MNLSSNALVATTLCLITYASPGLAGDQKYLQPCSSTSECSASYTCINNHCDYPTNVSTSVSECKEKLVANGVGNKELVANVGRFCYHDASCPGLYEKIETIARAEKKARRLSKPGRVYYTGEAEKPAAVPPAEARAAVDAAIVAAEQACTSCKVDGRPRCIMK